MGAAGGGYFIKESTALNMVLTFNEQEERAAAECQERGHHTPGDGDGDWIICTTCHAPLQRPDGKPGAGAGADGSPPDYQRPGKEEFNID